MARAELSFESLDVSEQVFVRTLTDELKDISGHIASAARYGAMTSHRLAGIANTQAQAIDDAAPCPDAIKMVHALQTVANDAGKTAIGLIAANKDAGKEPDYSVPHGLTHFYGSSDS